MLHHSVSRWNATPRPLLSARVCRAPYAAIRFLKWARARRSVLSACAMSFPATCRPPLPVHASAHRPRLTAVPMASMVGVGLAMKQALPSTPHFSYKRPRSCLGCATVPASQSPLQRHHGRPRPSCLLHTSPQPVRPPSPPHVPTDDARVAVQHASATVSPEHGVQRLPPRSCSVRARQ
jgi:hypothetical protein